MVVEAIPIAEADLRPLFGEMSPSQIEDARASLLEAAGQLKVLGEFHWVQAGWTGAGLELETLPSGQASIAGFVQPPDASFLVELRPPNYYLSAESNAWEIEASISVRCDSTSDCGMHLVLAVAEVEVASAEAAIAEFVSAVERLCDIATSEPPGAWRERDPESGHT